MARAWCARRIWRCRTRAWPSGGSSSYLWPNSLPGCTTPPCARRWRSCWRRRRTAARFAAGAAERKRGAEFARKSRRGAHRSERPSEPPLGPLDASLAGTVDLEPVQREAYRPQGLELDFGVVALDHLAPAIDARLALDAFAAFEWPQELAGVVSRGRLFSLRPRQRLHDVAAEQLRPVTLKQRRRSEDIAPGHLGAIGHYDAHDVLALVELGYGAVEASLDFFGKRLDRHTHRRRLVELGVGFGPSLRSDRG